MQQSETAASSEPRQGRGESKKKIHEIMIKILDDGKFLYRVMGSPGDGMMSGDEYAYNSIDEVKKAIEDDLGSPHMRGPMPPKGKLSEAFHEVYANEPKIVAHTKAKFGKERARKQMVAIAINKARGGLFKK